MSFVGKSRSLASFGPRFRVASKRLSALGPRPLSLAVVSVFALLALAAPAAHGQSCSSGPFGPGNWPPGCWRPYASSSPFNRPLPAHPRTVPNSSAILERVRGDISAQDRPGNLIANARGNAGEPTYYSRPADPLFTLNCTKFGGNCPIDGMAIRIPAGAVPEGGPGAAVGADRHMTIVDQASGWEYDLWQVQATQPLPGGGGQLDLSWGGRARLDGDGLAHRDTPAGHATASHFGSLAGRLRAEELERGEIDHALFIVINCDNGRFVYPARASDQSCSKVGLSNENAPPMGSHLQLAMSPAEIEALEVPAWKKTILRAMAKYGMFFGDTGSKNYFTLETEAGNQYQSLGFGDKWWSFGTTRNWEPFDPTPALPGSGDEDLVGKLYNNGRDQRDGIDRNIDWDRDVWSKLRVIDPCVASGECIVDATAPACTLAVPRQKLGAVTTRGLRVLGSCNEASSLALQLRVDGKTAKRLGLSRGKPVTVGSGSGRLASAGTTTVTGRLTPKARAAFGRAREVKVSAHMRARDGAKNASNVSRTVTLKR